MGSKKKKQKRFVVGIPITGQMTIEVEALDEDAALEAAWEQFNENGHDDFEVEWEAVNEVTTGNVTHAMLNEAYAEEVDE